MTRTAKVVRATAETDIGLSVDLDGTGAADVETGVGFFDHMLCALARHSLVDLTVRVKGDTEVDDHHTVEDTGIVLGQALREALGDKRGHPPVWLRDGAARRGAGHGPPWTSPVAASSTGDVPIGPSKVGTFDTELAHEFFAGLARDAGITLHLRLVTGENAHHIIEATFKAAARALREAVESDPRVEGVPPRRGSL